MISPLQTAISGLHGLSTRLRSNASNIANLSTEHYKRTRVLLSDAQPYGVKTTVEKIDSPGAMIQEETNNGYEAIELSNVDLGRELPEMNTNATFYKADAQTIKVADEMLSTLLQIKA